MSGRGNSLQWSRSQSAIRGRRTGAEDSDGRSWDRVEDKLQGRARREAERAGLTVQPFEETDGQPNDEG